MRFRKAYRTVSIWATNYIIESTIRAGQRSDQGQEAAVEFSGHKLTFSSAAVPCLEPTRYTAMPINTVCI